MAGGWLRHATQSGRPPGKGASRWPTAFGWGVGWRVGHVPVLPLICRFWGAEVPAGSDRAVTALDLVVFPLAGRYVVSVWARRARERSMPQSRSPAIPGTVRGQR